MPECRDVLDGHFAIRRKVGIHGSHRRIDANDTRSNGAEKLERAHDADQPVATHAKVSDVVEEDDARGCARRYRWRHQRSDDSVVTTRLTNDSTAKHVVAATHGIPAIPH